MNRSVSLFDTKLYRDIRSNVMLESDAYADLEEIVMRMREILDNPKLHASTMDRLSQLSRIFYNLDDNEAQRAAEKCSERIQAFIDGNNVYGDCEEP